ncbi:MAG: ArnT family glycosyltransferase, partial [Anaerolineales bacterium]
MSHRQSQGDFPQSATQDRQYPIWPGVLLILLAATFFRSLPLLENRFHPDEALYASFGRLIASGQDVLLSHVLVDKPPLSFYLTALSFLLFGNHELAARLPTLLASLVSIALVFALARRLYNRTTAYFAALALALSPFAILFSITAFVDPLLTALVLWGLWLILHRRYRRAGLAFALAFATKQTALLFVPLALAIGLLALPATATVQDALRQLRSIASPLLGGLVLVTLTVLTWEVARRPPISFWEQGYSDNVPGRFIRANEVLPRARAWLALLDYTTASAPLNSLFLLGLPVLLIA